MVSHIEVKRATQSLNRLDLRRADYASLKKRVSDITQGVRIPIVMSPSTEMFFRVRKNPSTRPQHLDDLGAPKPEYATGFQRCNAPGKPMFYAATNRKVALQETRIEEGDLVYLSQWMPNSPIPLNEVFSTEGGLEKTGDIKPVDATIHTFFDTLFTRKIHEDFSHEYKLTAAISHLLTTNFSPNVDYSIKTDGLVGLRYPSVFDLDGGANVALHPKFSMERLIPIHVMEARISTLSGNSLEFQVLDNAFEFSSGKIVWTGDPNAIPIEKENGNLVPFIRLNNRWTYPIRSEPHTQEDLQRLIGE